MRITSVECHILVAPDLKTNATSSSQDELFITTASLEWKTTYAPDGHNYGLPKGGSIYIIDTDFEGKKEFPANV